MNRPGDRNIWDQVRRHPWKWRRRTAPIRIILIHATRGGQRHTTEREFEAMQNWETSPNNRIEVKDGAGNVIDVYGSMASCCIGAGGLLMTMMPDDIYPYASAGHMDPIAKSYEVCQSNDGMPYDPRDIDRLVEEVAEDCVQYNIPPRELVFVSGDNHEAPGIARHDRSANGTKWGKSDPGGMFPPNFYTRVAARVQQLKNGEEPMTVEERRRLEAVEQTLERTRWSYLTFAMQKNKEIEALQKHAQHPPGKP